MNRIKMLKLKIDKGVFCMNDILKVNDIKSGFDWTSLQIAEWIGKEHYNVLRDIED
jgi:phage regulator Rha-like protein